MAKLGIFSTSSLEIKISSEDPSTIIALIALLGVLLIHELIHFSITKRWDRNAKIILLGPKLYKIRFPTSFLLIYNGITIIQYIIIALSPQILSIMFLLLIIMPISEALKNSIYIIYFFHLISSAGDFYGVLFVIYKFRFKPVKLSCLTKDNEFIGVKVEPL